MAIRSANEWGATVTRWALIALGVSIPVKYRGEKVVSWVGYLVWEFLEPFRSKR